MAHADWSVSPAKRWMCVAQPIGSGWQIGLERVGDLPSWVDRLRARACGAPVAIGVDAPIGLPLAYRRPHADFPSFLRTLTPDAPFFDVADSVEDISLERPFYPQRSLAGRRRADLLGRLGLTEGAQLLRHCEHRLGSQNAAAPMFWTLGASQVGKGAIRLWRDLLLPAIRAEPPLSLWPFDGSLADLLRRGGAVIAETYPANAMRQMGLGLQGSKRRQSDRAAVARTFATLLQEVQARPDRDLAAQIGDGFGPANDGEDRFDSLIGLIRMLQIFRDPALDQRPPSEICRWEGWILGRPLSFP